MVGTWPERNAANAGPSCPTHTRGVAIESAYTRLATNLARRRCLVGCNYMCLNILVHSTGGLCTWQGVPNATLYTDTTCFCCNIALRIPCFMRSRYRQTQRYNQMYFHCIVIECFTPSRNSRGNGRPKPQGPTYFARGCWRYFSSTSAGIIVRSARLYAVALPN